jgi:glycosyltransferase involved in cell wall biosynthesis
VAISTNVQARIKKYLDRETTVIYPPTATSNFHYQKNGDFWLSVNRLINHKRLEIQLEAFRQLPTEKLIIVGSYESASHFRHYAEHIIANKPDNVEILSWVDYNKVIDLYANCKGFITTALDEDFGLTAIEAMAAGKPVIAPDEGGYRETVLDGLTGKLITDIDATKLATAIQELGARPESYRIACQTQAQKFDTKIFIAKIKQIVYGH